MGQLNYRSIFPKYAAVTVSTLELYVTQKPTQLPCETSRVRQLTKYQEYLLVIPLHRRLCLYRVI